MKFLPYILKNLWRHRARTVLTVSGSGVALFVFAVIGSVQEGLNRLSEDQRSRRTLIVFQANRFCPSTSKLPEHYATQIAKMEGVRIVVPIKVFMNNCRASLDLVVFHGIPAPQLKSARSLNLVAGSWDDFERERKAAVVGRSLARRRGLSPGQTFSIGEAKVVIAGIFDADSPSEEQFLYCHLEFLQRTPGLNSVGTVTQFEVALHDGVDPDRVAREIDHRFQAGPIATDTRTKNVFEQNAVGDLIELISLARYIGVACVILVLALVATTTIMAVQDRVREHAVLQTLGFTQWHIAGFVLVESVLVGFAGGAMGIGTAMIALHFGSWAVGTEGVSVAFTPTMQLALTGLVASMLVGIVAGLVPAIQAARAEIVTSLRAV